MFYAAVTNREIECSRDADSLPPRTALSQHYVFTRTAKANSGRPHHTQGSCGCSYVGLSYEVQQLADSGFFSAQKSDLIRAFKALSSTGVLRLGGNTSELAYWNPSLFLEPEHPQTREVVGEPQAQYYPVTVDALRNLAEFL